MVTGAKVVSVSNVAENCNTVTDAIIAEGNDGMAFTADCTKEEDCKALLEAAKAKYGKVDILINAGIHSALPMGFGKMDHRVSRDPQPANRRQHFWSSPSTRN